MRKHFIPILLPLVVLLSIYWCYTITCPYSQSFFNSENTSCEATSDPQCSVDNRRKMFQKQWQMGIWNKVTLL